MHKIVARKALIAGEIDIYLFHLTNGRGVCVEIINYGATIVSIGIPVNGILKKIVLGYEKIEDYFSDTAYLGATIGRFANRISGSAFRMDGKIYRLDKNDGDHCNHGGFEGFNRKVFDWKIEDNKLILFAMSKDGEAGFPGNVILTVSYSLSEDNELIMDYTVTADRKTPVNITNHAYFNLSGEKDILGHHLKIESDSFLESDEQFLPTGRKLWVEENPGFDFRSFAEIGKNALLKNEKMKGYNTYFIAREETGKLKKLATLRSERTGVNLEVHSTMPGIMIYTGDYLSGGYQPFSGISLEAHGFPDSLNIPAFPQSFVSKEKVWRETIMYRFLVKE